MALIAEHGVGEAVFLNELFLLGGWIGTHTDDPDTPFLELLEFVTESLALDGSAGGAGFGKEPQDDLMTAEVLEGNEVFIGVRQGEVGRRGASIEQHILSSHDELQNALEI
jgi:hypothetical protein